MPATAQATTLPAEFQLAPPEMQTNAGKPSVTIFFRLVNGDYDYFQGRLPAYKNFNSCLNSRLVSIAANLRATANYKHSTNSTQSCCSDSHIL